MKKQTNLILALLIGVALVGCDSLLDLEPQNSIQNEIALITPANVQSALVGGYALLGGGNAYGGSYIYLTELYAAPNSEINFIGTFIAPREFSAKNILKTNGFSTAYWTNSYNIIKSANNVLSALDIFGTDTAERERVEAEARFLRGVAYYNLVQVFGRAYNDGNPATNPGVPIVLTPTLVNSPELQVPRNTVTQVYAQVLADLTAAKAALPLGNGYYANTMVASAFLSRVHLAMGNYPAAAAEADRVIASGRYILFSNIQDNYNRTINGNFGSTEIIYATQVTTTHGANDMAVYHAPTPFGRADIRILAPHLANYEVGDVRRTLFINTSRGTMTTKYHATPPADSRRFNITVMRLAEMYLTRAEANFRITGSLVPGVGAATPEADVNLIRVRVNLPPLAVVTLADILKERRNELIFEGSLHLDTKRNQVATTGANVGGTTNVPWNSPRFVFPIPDRECKVNDKLIQNEGYGVCD